MVQLYERKESEFLVNTQTTGFQDTVQLEPLSNGGFIAVWTDRQFDGAESTDSEVKGQRFDAAGNKVGAEFLVNTTTAAFQYGAKVTTLPSGRFVIIWEDQSGLGGDSAPTGVKAQLFEADGTKVGAEFLVNTTVADTQWMPAVTELTGGGFVVAWTDQSVAGGDPIPGSIKAQLYTAAAVKVGGELLVNTTTASNQMSPAITALGGGGFAVTWTDFSATDGDVGSGVRMQRFDAVGVKLGAEVHVNTDTAGSQSAPAIAQLAGGGFVVTWSDRSLSDDTSGFGIKGQLFDAAGLKVGGEFLVNSVLTGDQTSARVAAVPGGGFVVVWSGPSATAADTIDIKARLFDAAGNKTGVEFLVNSVTAGDQTFASVAVLASGDIVIGWTDASGTGADTSHSGVKAQIFTPTTAPPSDIAFSGTTVSETTIENFSIATIAATGPISGSYTYAIVSDSSGGAFRIEGDRLIVDDNSRLDFETQPTVEIRIRATDLNGQTFEETTLLTVTDAVIEKRYAADEVLNPGSAVNTYTIDPTIIAVGSGGALVTWLGLQDGTLFGRIYDPNGTPVGATTTLLTTDWPDGFELASLPNGDFIVAYVGRQPASGVQLNVQRFDEDGAKIGDAIVVVAEDYGPRGVAVTALESGGFVVTWVRLIPNTGTQYEIRGQLFDADGNEVAGEFLAHSMTTFGTIMSQVSALPDGGFVVAWHVFGDDDFGGQRFDAQGTMQGGPFAFVNLSNTVDLEVTALADGRVAALRVDKISETGNVEIDELTVQIVDQAGNAVGDEILVGTGISQVGEIVALPDGGFAVSWLGTDRNVHAQLFNEQGLRVGDSFIVAVDGRAGSHNLSVGPEGELLFSWSSGQGNLGSTPYDVKARIIRPATQDVVGSAANDLLTGTVDGETISGLGGNDQLFLQQGGNDDARGGEGNDGIYFGAALDGSDRADGGAGIDTLAIQGGYANLVLSGVTNVEVLLAASGSDTRFGDMAGASYDYDITSADANVAAGETLTVIGSGLLAGEDLVFNGSAETDGRFRLFAGCGNDQLTGGAGGDGFFFGSDGNLTGADRINGGAGTDSLALRGNYVGAAAVVFQDASFTNVEVLTFLSAHTSEFGGVVDPNGFDYDVTLADGNIAAGARLDIIAGNLRANESARVDARAELDGSVRIIAGAGDDILFGSAGNDTLYGGLGADALDGDAGNDIYVYRIPSESTAASRDTIAFATGDRIDLSLIDADTVGAAGNEAFAFIGTAAFSNVAGQLRASQSGGQWIVEGDVNGDGVADLVVAVVSAAPLTAPDFIL